MKHVRELKGEVTVGLRGVNKRRIGTIGLSGDVGANGRTGYGRRSGERVPIHRERKWAIGDATQRTGADLHKMQT